MDKNEHPLWKNIFRHKDRVTEVAKLWAETPLFIQISATSIHELVGHMHPRAYTKNEVVFKTGDIGAGAVLIKSGRVAIKAGEQTLALLEPGDFFGEVALVVDEPRTADAVAVEASELIFFLRPDLEEWIHNAPKQGAQLMINLSRVLAGRLRHANDMLSQSQSD